MKKTTLAIVVLLLIASSFMAGNRYNKRSTAGNGEKGGRKILYYIDPMHPAYKSDEPGVAPDCGMQLEPVYEGRSEGEGSGSLPPGTVRITPEQQQLIGVQVTVVEKASPNHHVRIVGRVVPDETRIYRITSAIDGWVRSISPVTTGSLVQKDDLLANVYTPEYFSAMKAYLYALKSMTRFEESGKETKEQLDLTNANIENYRNALRNLGMTDHQLDEIRQTRRNTETIELRAPASGFVLVRNLFSGQRFEKGLELYRIADLSRVWILADSFDDEARHLKPGTPVTVTLPNQQKSFRALVSGVLPQFDAATRTMKVRLEAGNPGFLLRPDMFVDVELPVSLPSAITVPVDAVLDSGIRKTVFVDHGNGYFEPRKVETGWRYGERVQIVKGIATGEKIVVSGNFLLDSESRMKAAATTVATATDPTCGHIVDRSAAKASGRTAGVNGKIYYFCSEECKKKFEKESAISPAREARAEGAGSLPRDMPRHD